MSFPTPLDWRTPRPSSVGVKTPSQRVAPHFSIQPWLPSKDEHYLSIFLPHELPHFPNCNLNSLSRTTIDCASISSSRISTLTHLRDKPAKILACRSRPDSFSWRIKMPSYNASQRSSISQFVNFTSTKESIAGRVSASYRGGIAGCLATKANFEPMTNSIPVSQDPRLECRASFRCVSAISLLTRGVYGLITWRQSPQGFGSGRILKLISGCCGDPACYALLRLLSATPTQYCRTGEGTVAVVLKTALYSVAGITLSL